MRAVFLGRDPGPEEGGWPPPLARRAGADGGSGGPGRWPALMVFPPGAGTSFTIGRTHDCDLRIADLSVSRLHAQLERGEDGWLVADLGSHNGTRVNGWRIREPVPVRAGDVLQFGSVAFVIHDQQGPPDPVRDGRDGTDGCAVAP